MADAKITIAYDPATGLRVVASAGDAAGAGPTARVGFELTTDEVRRPKRRDGESDDAYAARVAKVLPDAIQVPPEYLAGLAERCRDILDGLDEVLSHHAGRAALEHALLAEGKSPPGVKSLKTGGGLGGLGAADRKKA